MSVHADRRGWIVRWRDGSGRQRGRRFPSEDAARAFDAGLREAAGPRKGRAVGAKSAGGVYPYRTRSGIRWYFKARDSTGQQMTRRGFTSERAARALGVRHRAPTGLRGNFDAPEPIVYGSTLPQIGRGRSARLAFGGSA